MAIQLVVTNAFGPFAKGDHITDPALIAKWGASHPEYVVRKVLEGAAPSTSSSPSATSSASPTVPQLKPVV